VIEPLAAGRRHAERRICSTERLTIVAEPAMLIQVVERSTAHLDAVFHALADPTRREILRRLARHDRTVGELAAPFDMSLAAVSKHIGVLERARLLRRSRDGRVHRCRLEVAPLRDAARVLTALGAFWEARLDALERHLLQARKRGS
jgi:DNA-binding transcriptional ArsR family regulator